MKYFERGRGLTATVKARHHAGETQEIAEEALVAGLTGAALGAASAKLKGGLDQGGVPTDLAGGAILMGASLVAGDKKSTRDNVRLAGAVAFGIGASRQTAKWMGGRSKAHGEVDETFDDDDVDMGNDPIMRAAANL